ncbi:RidA family protein [Deinococcus sp.]|uniref:RidA family protein n=1 Tax=Deinococcus sp. TaxID=47478 RepID=UPI003CC5B511
MIRHNPPTLPAPVGQYSQAVEVPAGRLLFISGQIPEGVPGSADSAVPTGFEAQARQVWANILEVLAAARMTPANLVKVTTYLTDSDQIDVNGQVRREVLGELEPALTVIIARTLDPRWLLEIEAVAAG